VIRFQPIKPLPRVLGGWSDASLARQVARASEQVELVDPTLWINDLDMTRLALETPWPVVYDITDDWLLASVPRRIARSRRRRERSLLQRADEVVVCSTGLQNTKGTFRDVAVIGNAVDIEHFRAPRPRPTDLPRGQVAVYVGTLHEDRLDVELVTESARALPDVQFVFVGPDALNEASHALLRPMTNVHLLGPRPFRDVPAYLQHADVCVVPHVVSSFTESLDPIKAYECLAVGLPTLSTPVAGFRDVGEPVHIASSEDFPNALRELIARTLPPVTSPRLPSWRDQAQHFADVLESGRLARQSSAGVRVVYLDHVARMSGGEVALARMLPDLIAAGVDAHVILGEHGPLEGLLRDAGATVEVLAIDPGVRDTRRDALTRLGTIRTMAKTASYVFALRRRLRELQADVVHTNSLKSSIYGGVAGRAARVPVVWHVRDRIAADYLPASTVRIVRMLARALPSRIIANSKATLDTLAGRGEVIHDGYRSSASTHRCDRAVQTIAIIGRVSPWKGQHVVLEAFARAFPNSGERCLIVGTAMFGEDDYLTHLRELADQLGIADRVDFLGHVDDVESILSTVDVLVHASTTPEPFGQVILEGLAAGVPVIASDAGGAREIVTHGIDGILTPPGDVLALATALRQLADDPVMRERIAVSGTKRAKDFDPAHMTARYLATYRDARRRR
jgi:glycosyltransferase involved in cell wall biosynthesis